MSSTLSELGQYLEDLAIGTQSTDLWLGSMPDSPDTVLVIYQYPGNEPEYVQNHASPVAERPQIQVVTRAIKYEDAHYLASAAWSALAVITNMMLGSTYYRSVRPNGSPGILLRDSNDRVLIFFNASVEKEVSLEAAS